MTAASYWSLLEPAIDAATSSQLYGAQGQYAFIPVSLGFIAGAAFVFAADKFLPGMVILTIPTVDDYIHFDYFMLWLVSHISFYDQEYL